IADGAFAPLADWADYIVSANTPSLEPWVAASSFDFAPFVSSGLEWGVAPARTTDDEPDRKKKKPERTNPVVVEPQTAPPPVEPKTRAAEPRTTEAPRTQVPIDAELAALEAEFIALDAPGDAPERLALLDRLGRVYARLGRRRDAGLCFARAVWEATPQ